MSRRTTITTYSRELITIRTQTPNRTADRSAESREGWCEQCAADSFLITPEQAAALTGIKTRVIYRWAETGMLHSIETENRDLLICVNSLGIDLPAQQNAPAPGAPDAVTVSDQSSAGRQDAPDEDEVPTLKLRAIPAPTARLGAVLKCRERIVNGVLVIGLEGRLDIQTAAKFEEWFLGLMNTGVRKLVFDCSALDFISTSGMWSFLHVARQLAKVGSRIALYDLNGSVARAFKTKGLATMFRLFSTEEEAILGLAVTGLLPRLRSQSTAAMANVRPTSVCR